MEQEYSIELIDASMSSIAGASFPAKSNEEAEDEARALALMHETAVRARLHRKGAVLADGRPDVWWIDLEGGAS